MGAALLAARVAVIIIAVARVVRIAKGKTSCLGTEDGHSDQPEDDFEYFKGEDGPIIVRARTMVASDENIDDNDKGCDTLDKIMLAGREFSIL
jgi:hypothetical protein